MSPAWQLLTLIILFNDQNKPGKSELLPPEAEIEAGQNKRICPKMHDSSIIEPVIQILASQTAKLIISKKNFF